MKKQPKALYVLFLTEMWERFGYFTMATIFVLYLTNQLKLTDDRAFLIFGAFNAFAYLTTVAGGVLADRLLGFRAAILIGALIMSSGYLLLQVQAEAVMYFALALLVVGNGLFKPNTSALLGTYYGEGENTRRDAGFTLFYMGVNTGAFAGALVAGVIATTFGYGWAFALAGVGKLVSFGTFFYGRRFLEDHGHPPRTSPFSLPGYRHQLLIALFVIGIIGAVGIATFLIKHGYLAGGVLAVGGLGVTALFIFEIFREPAADRPKLWALLVLIAFAIVFFSVYMQAGSSVNLFTERAVNLQVLGVSIPPSDIQSLNPFFILVLAPVFAWVWVRLSRRRGHVPIALKFTLGLAFIGAAYLSLRFAGMTTGDQAKVNLTWMVWFFLLYTMGELSLSPVGLSMAAGLAPRRLAGFAMGMWMLSISAANYISGLIAEIASVPAGTDATGERHIYEAAFTDYGLMAVSAALLLLALTPALHRIMRS